MNHELPGVQAGFRKDRGTRDQIANICWIIEKQESSRKTSTSALLTTPKTLAVWITTNKDSEDVGIPVELFQILKDDAMKVLHAICQQI